MQKITPFLWFEDQAEEAARFYASVFKNSEVTSVSPGPNGKAMSVTFRLEDQEFMALNAGPQFKLRPCKVVASENVVIKCIAQAI